MGFRERLALAASAIRYSSRNAKQTKIQIG
jgi:hypothetical protein